MFFVIGSRNSSNSLRLVEVAKNSGCENSILLHSESKVPFDKIDKCKTIGISSGASAPEVLVDQFIDEIESLDMLQHLLEGNKFNVVDMEAYALAKLSLIEGINFFCFKYITDKSDKDASSDWKKNKSNGAADFIGLLDSIES